MSRGCMNTARRGSMSRGRTSFRIVLLYWVVALGFFMPGAVYAYIDPATTTYLIQIITALVVTVGVSLSVFLFRLRMVFSEARYRLLGFFYRLGSGSRQGSVNRPVSKKRPGQKEEWGDPWQKKEGGDPEQNTENAGQEAYTAPDYVWQGSKDPPDLMSFDDEFREALFSSRMGSAGAPAGLANIWRKESIFAEPGAQKYAGRLKAALPLSLATCLTFILLGCMALVIENPADITFKLSAVLPVLLLAFAVCFAACLFIIPIFRGKVYLFVISLLLAVLTAGYIQGNFLNRGLGELTGDAIDWGLHKPLMAGSLLFWGAVFVVVLILVYYSITVRRILFVFVPVIIIVAQAAGLVSLAGKTNANEWSAAMFWEQADERLTIDKMAEPGYEKNAIVFVLDRMDQSYIDEIMAEDPQFFGPLDGFTMFDDNISYAASTFPSVTGMLTGHIYRWDVSNNDYMEYAWANADFMHALRERGVDIRLYMDFGYTYSDIGQLRGIASNIVEGTIEINDRIALVKLLKLSAFRYAPMPAKALFWMSPTEFTDVFSLSAETAPYMVNDFAFYANIAGQGLSPSGDRAAFAYYHMLGPHPPFQMDENIEYVAGWTTPLQQAKGSLRIVFEYIRQLKELGLYKDATIIITADHGAFSEEGLLEPAHAALLVKPAGSAGTGLAVSHAPVCPDQLPGTVMEGFFGDNGGFGPGYLDIEEGAGVVREYDFRLDHYEITGDGRDFSNWRHIKAYPDTWEGDF